MTLPHDGKTEAPTLLARKRFDPSEIRNHKVGLQFLGWMRRGEPNDSATGGTPGRNAWRSILEHQAGTGIDAESSRTQPITLGRRLAVHDAVARNEQRRQGQARSRQTLHC